MTIFSYVQVRKSRQVIRFPQQPAVQEVAAEGFYTERRRIPNVLGCIDGSLVPIKSPSQHEEAYVCRKGFHAINVQCVCTHDLRFTNIVARWPGSTHDAFIWSNCELKDQLQRGIGNGGYLLGDQAYPLRPFLLTPVRNPQDEAERLYNAHHRRARTIIEQTFARWKMRWLCLNREGNVGYGQKNILSAVVIWMRFAAYNMKSWARMHKTT